VNIFFNNDFQIYGCENSALFRTFSEHILHRLQIKENLPDKKSKLRITFLARETKYRKVINEDELIKRIKANPKYSVKRVNYGGNLSFKDQLRITRNSDVFIGIHGAGLTHLLFLPNWATIFELYHCEDPNCYKDLARLRGMNYVTWEDNALLESFDAGYKNGDHEKFKNYRFDVDEFERLVEKSAEAVFENPEYNEYLSKIQHDEL
jgi:EGF domain-specific O-GlcNAc transferase